MKNFKIKHLLLCGFLCSSTIFFASDEQISSSEFTMEHARAAHRTIKDLQTEVSDLQKAVECEASVANGLKGRLQLAHKSLEQVDVFRDLADQRKDELQEEKDELTKLRSAAHANGVEINELKDQREQRGHELGDLRFEVSERDEQLRVVQRNVQSLTQEQQELEERRAVLESELKRAVQSVKTSRGNAQLSEKHAATLERQLKEAVQAGQVESRNLHAVQQELQQAKVRFDEESRELEQTLAAREDAFQAGDVTPDSPQSSLGVAVLFDAQKQQEEAQAALQKALAEQRRLAEQVTHTKDCLELEEASAKARAKELLEANREQKQLLGKLEASQLDTKRMDELRAALAQRAGFLQQKNVELEKSLQLSEEMQEATAEFTKLTEMKAQEHVLQSKQDAAQRAALEEAHQRVLEEAAQAARLQFDAAKAKHAKALADAQRSWNEKSAMAATEVAVVRDRLATELRAQIKRGKEEKAQEVTAAHSWQRKAQAEAAALAEVRKEKDDSARSYDEQAMQISATAAELKRKIAYTEAQDERLTTEFDTVRQQLAREQANVADWHGKFKELQSKVERLNGVDGQLRAELERKIAHTEAQDERLTTELDTVRQQLARAEANVADWYGKFKKLQPKVERLSGVDGQLHAESVELAKARGELNRLRGAVDVLVEQVPAPVAGDASSNVADVGSRAQALEAVGRYLQTEVQALADARGEHAAEIATLQAQLAGRNISLVKYLMTFTGGALADHYGHVVRDTLRQYAPVLLKYLREQVASMLQRIKSQKK